MTRLPTITRTGRHRTLAGLLALLLIAGCAPQSDRSPAQPSSGGLAVLERDLADPGHCEGRFVAHELDHTTETSETVRLFESNGSGVAINDLNNDGRLDVVLANIKGNHTILWNEGELAFRRERLPYRHGRAVTTVDVEGDGWVDIIFTGGSTAPLRLRNRGPVEPGQVRFVHEPLPGVHHPAYSLNWGDLTGDGRLDLVTGSYDAARMLEQADRFLFGDRGGVLFYEQQAERFRPHRLAREAQANTILLVDVEGDARQEILVGNDFDAPLQVWQRAGEAWQPITPFTRTSHNVMGLDYGDTTNDGHLEIFSTDMKPYRYDPETIAAWLPLMEGVYRSSYKEKVQRTANVLQVRDRDGAYRDRAYDRGVDATGWGWSGKFGDLNNDGFLDLYVVNGMIAADLFPYLPDHELVEENQALRNEANGHFRPAPEWRAGATASGRGMSMADLNGNGKLDIVINNLGSPALLLENRLCAGASLQVELVQPESGNRFALGATLFLHTERGTLRRDVRAASGYLSGDPVRVHFGFPEGTDLQALAIRWPDGAHSTVRRLRANSLLHVTRR